MRTIWVNLYQNTGTSKVGNLFAVYQNQVENLATIRQEVDGSGGSLTKVTPGDVVLKVVDPTGDLWEFISTQLTLIPGITSWRQDMDVQEHQAVMANGGAYVAVVPGRTATSGTGPSGTGTALQDGTVTWRSVQHSGLLPPWIEVYVDGVRKFLGLVDPSKMVKNDDPEDDSIEIGASGWSTSLSSIYLGTPTCIPWVGDNLYLADQQVTNAGAVYLCTVPGVSASSGGPTGIGTDIVDGEAHWSWVAPTWRRPIPAKANRGSNPGSQAGFSYSNVYLQLGQFRNAVFISNPCTGFARDSVVTMTRPVFAYRPVSGVSVGSGEGGDRMRVPGNTITDADGQIWTYQVVGTREGGGIILYDWVLTTPWTTPGAAGTATALPNTNFPAGLIMRAPSGLWQVSADGRSWGAVYDNSYDSPYFTVLDCKRSNDVYPASRDSAGATEVLLSLNPWPTTTKVSGSWEADFVLNGATLEDVTYWLTTATIPENPSPECHFLPLDGVDGIVPGDNLATRGSDRSDSWTVAGVDPILRGVTTVESISDVAIGTHIGWTDESAAELCKEDPRSILTRAVFPYGVDLTQFTAPATAEPVFGWIPSPAAIGDVWATRTGLKASQAGRWGMNQVVCNSWVGTPDAGWTLTTETAYQPTADWTSQLVDPPAFLMPYSLSNVFQALRNRAYSEFTYRQKDNGLIVINGTWINGQYVRTLADGRHEYTENGQTYSTDAGGDNFTTWSPNGAGVAGVLTVYDYHGMRELVVNGAALQVRHWTDAATSTLEGSYNWPGGRLVQSLVPWAAISGSYLAYTIAPGGGGDRLELWGLAGGLLNSTECQVPEALKGGNLTTTPWATYLVGAAAIAQVVFADGAITLVTQYFVDEVTCFFPNSLAARNSGEFIIFGRKDSGGENDRTTETRLLRVARDLTPTLGGSVFLSEKIADGCPTVLGATRDPSKPGRLVGHYGGSTWQVDAQLPMAIDRFAPSGLTAMELVEHVCQLFACLAIPDANGVMRFVPRAAQPEVIAITVPRVRVKKTRKWPEHSTIIRCSVGDGLSYDARGQEGGGLLELNDNPLIHLFSGCMALAQALAPWFGQIRDLSEEDWFWEDADGTPIWESLLMAGLISVNGGPPVYLMALENNIPEGEASVKTVGV